MQSLSTECQAVDMQLQSYYIIEALSNPNADAKYYYGVSIMNGKQAGARTHSPHVFITLTGTNGCSGRLHLHGYLSLFTGGNDHVDKLDCVAFESSGDLGEIMVVTLGIGNSSLCHTWYVREVGVYNFQSETKESFPCYHWIRSGHSVSVTTKTGKHIYMSICYIHSILECNASYIFVS